MAPITAEPEPHGATERGRAEAAAGGAARSREQRPPPPPRRKHAGPTGAGTRPPSLRGPGPRAAPSEGPGGAGAVPLPRPHCPRPSRAAPAAPRPRRARVCAPRSAGGGCANPRQKPNRIAGGSTERGPPTLSARGRDSQGRGDGGDSPLPCRSASAVPVQLPACGTWLFTRGFASWRRAGWERQEEVSRVCTWGTGQLDPEGGRTSKAEQTAWCGLVQPFREKRAIRTVHFYGHSQGLHWKNNLQSNFHFFQGSSLKKHQNNQTKQKAPPAPKIIFYEPLHSLGDMSPASPSSELACSWLMKKSLRCG